MKITRKTLRGMAAMTDETRLIVSTVLEVKPVRRELLRLARCYQRRYGVDTGDCFDMFRDRLISFFLDRLDVESFRSSVNAEVDYCFEGNTDWKFVTELCFVLLHEKNNEGGKKK